MRSAHTYTVNGILTAEAIALHIEIPNVPIVLIRKSQANARG